MKSPFLSDVPTLLEPATRVVVPASGVVVPPWLLSSATGAALTVKLVVAAPFVETIFNLCSPTVFF